jgi:hypothetical protein
MTEQTWRADNSLKGLVRGRQMRGGVRGRAGNSLRGMVRGRQMRERVIGSHDRSDIEGRQLTQGSGWRQACQRNDGRQARHYRAGKELGGQKTH